MAFLRSGGARLRRLTMRCKETLAKNVKKNGKEEDKAVLGALCVLERVLASGREDDLLENVADELRRYASAFGWHSYVAAELASDV